MFSSGMLIAQKVMSLVRTLMEERLKQSPQMLIPQQPLLHMGETKNGLKFYKLGEASTYITPTNEYVPLFYKSTKRVICNLVGVSTREVSNDSQLRHSKRQVSCHHFNRDGKPVICDPKIHYESMSSSIGEVEDTLSFNRCYLYQLGMIG